MNIYFMRHGETTWNTVKRIQGTTDIPLNENGIKLAEITAENTNKSGIVFDRIYTSPLIRAVKTAEAMNKYSNTEIIIENRIREFCFGKAEGQIYSEIINNPDYSFIRYWFTDPEKYQGGCGAETFEQFFERLTDFIENEIKPQEKKIDNVLITCHGGVVRGLRKVMLNLPTKDFANMKIPNCGINLINLENGIFNLKYEAKVFY